MDFDIFALVIAICALTLSITIFIQKRKFARAVVRFERIIGFETKLGEWDDLYKFHGIDMDTANKEGISKEQITYLVLSIGALGAYCGSGQKKMKRNLRKNLYRQIMFDQKETRRAYVYVRMCLHRNDRQVFDEYLKEYYGETYPKIEPMKNAIKKNK